MSFLHIIPVGYETRDRRKEKCFAQLAVLAARQRDHGKFRLLEVLAELRIGGSQLHAAHRLYRFILTFQRFGGIDKRTGGVSIKNPLEILDEPVLVLFLARQ